MKIILFDGACNLCNHTVQRIIQRDKKEVFHFASLQSRTGQELSVKFNFASDSVVLIDEGKVYLKSAAVLNMCKYLPYYRWALAGYMIPNFIRDKLYTYIAAHRYQWFGQKTGCMIPTPSIKKRFLD